MIISFDLDDTLIPAFNIDVHVDDSPGVCMEGERHQFKTIIIAETDTDWVNNILAQIAKS
jgi:hypothetical protein